MNLQELAEAAHRSVNREVTIGGVKVMVRGVGPRHKIFPQWNNLRAREDPRRGVVKPGQTLPKLHHAIALTQQQ